MIESKTENKRLSTLVDCDRGALSSYLGFVLGKRLDEMTAAEETQVRALMKDNGEG